MKSIRYLLGGQPHKLDDCFDLARKLTPHRVALDLCARPWATDLELFLDLIARYQWRFPGAACECEELCAEVRLRSDRRRQQRAVAQANQRLERCLRRMEQIGIPLNGRENRFSESVLLVEDRRDNRD